MSSIPLHDIDTPAFLVDLPTLRANIDRVAHSAAAAGLQLRPHCKAHKTPEIARLQLAAGAVGVTAAKVGEAEAMVEAGVGDVFIANEIVGESKLRRLAALRERARVSVACDSARVAQGYAEVFTDPADPLEIILEIDIGAHRCGVLPERATEMATAIARFPGLRTVGIMGYAPMTYGVNSNAEREPLVAAEGQLLSEVAARLASEGHAMERISGGCTPGATLYRAGCGLTEIRPGTYVFYDMNQVDLGVVGVGDVAATILSTVISTPQPGRAILDAGSKALATQVKPISAGCGFVKGHPGAVVDVLNDEHGYLSLEDSDLRVAVGDKLELIPPRVCTAVNLYDELHLVENGELVETCRITGRGKSR
jgi:D-serine deaminase-like pyridoxal phosphate-dependent protein